MTNIDFEAFREGIFAEYKAQLAHNALLFNDPSHEWHGDYERYNKDYMRSADVQSADLGGSGFAFIIQELKDFEEQCADYKSYPNFQVMSEVESQYESDDGECYMTATWKTPVEYNEQTAKSLVRKAFAKELAPMSRQSYPLTVDCKMMTLFKEGTITFEALRKITYGDCVL